MRTEERERGQGSESSRLLAIGTLLSVPDLWAGGGGGERRKAPRSSCGTELIVGLLYGPGVRPGVDALRAGWEERGL